MKFVKTIMMAALLTTAISGSVMAGDLPDQGEDKLPTLGYMGYVRGETADIPDEFRFSENAIKNITNPGFNPNAGKSDGVKKVKKYAKDVVNEAVHELMKNAAFPDEKTAVTRLIEAAGETEKTTGKPFTVELTGYSPTGAVEPDLTKKVVDALVKLAAPAAPLSPREAPIAPAAPAHALGAGRAVALPAVAPEEDEVTRLRKELAAAQAAAKKAQENLEERVRAHRADAELSELQRKTIQQQIEIKNQTIEKMRADAAAEESKKSRTYMPTEDAVRQALERQKAEHRAEMERMQASINNTLSHFDAIEARKNREIAKLQQALEAAQPAHVRRSESGDFSDDGEHDLTRDQNKFIDRLIRDGVIHEDHVDRENMTYKGKTIEAWKKDNPALFGGFPVKAPEAEPALERRVSEGSGDFSGHREHSLTDAQASFLGELIEKKAIDLKYLDLDNMTYKGTPIEDLKKHYPALFGGFPEGRPSDENREDEPALQEYAHERDLSEHGEHDLTRDQNEFIDRLIRNGVIHKDHVDRENMTYKGRSFLEAMKDNPALFGGFPVKKPAAEAKRSEESSRRSTPRGASNPYDSSYSYSQFQTEPKKFK